MKNNIIFMPPGSFQEFYKTINKELSKKYNVYNVVSSNQDIFYRKFNTNNIDIKFKNLKFNNSERIEILDFISKIEKKLKISINNICNYDRHTDRINVMDEIVYPKSKLSEITSNKLLREDYILGMVNYINNMILELKPVFLLLAAGDITNNLFITIANYYDIKSYHVFYPKTHTFKNGKRYISSKYNSEHQLISNEFEKILNSNNYIPSKEAKDIVSDFLETPISMANAPKKYGYKVFIRSILIVVKNIYLRRHNKFINYKYLSTILDHCKMILKYNCQYKNNTKTFNEIRSTCFIYFPIHQLPEITVYMWADDFSNQTNIIKKLANHMPFTKKLLIREHPNNIGRRPINYYDNWKKNPIIIIGSISDSQFNYIKESESVVTINGTTGWEAILMKKPVFTLQDISYDLIGYNKKLKYISQLDSVYNEHMDYINNISDDDYYQKIYKYIDAVINTTVEEDLEGAKNLIQFIENDYLTENNKYNFWEK